MKKIERYRNSHLDSRIQVFINSATHHRLNILATKLKLRLGDIVEYALVDILKKFEGESA